MFAKNHFISEFPPRIPTQKQMSHRNLKTLGKRAGFWDDWRTELAESSSFGLLEEQDVKWAPWVSRAANFSCCNSAGSL